MTALFEQIDQVAKTRVSVLIEGETGTGKELVAATVHDRSSRRERLFVTLNCATLTENLLESELFGHRRGAFTGATEEKKGLFEIADGGTLFLDEVTELPLTLQAKLLRALQEGEIRPVGSTRARYVDVRVVAATNTSLDEQVAQGKFREDLYYRLKVFPLRVPPLRERPDDVVRIANFFLERYSEEFGKSLPGFAAETARILQSYSWPGNVRQLENEVQRLILQTESGQPIPPELLSPPVRKIGELGASAAFEKGSLKELTEQFERQVVLSALESHQGNKTNTAKSLGITREGLHKKLKQLKL
jgi:Nif-specific regulatory protein